MPFCNRIIRSTKRVALEVLHMYVYVLCKLFVVNEEKVSENVVLIIA